MAIHRPASPVRHAGQWIEAARDMVISAWWARPRRTDSGRVVVRSSHGTRHWWPLRTADRGQWSVEWTERGVDGVR